MQTVRGLRLRDGWPPIAGALAGLSLAVYVGAVAGQPLSPRCWGRPTRRPATPELTFAAIFRPPAPPGPAGAASTPAAAVDAAPFIVVGAAGTPLAAAPRIAA